MFGLAACTGSMSGVVAEAVEVRDNGGALGDLLGAASSTAETITEVPSGMDKAAAATVGDPVVGSAVGDEGGQFNVFVKSNQWVRLHFGSLSISACVG
ncbi:uncharacterized protein HD556DRAFT_1445469 [Suillus plorans]|uniref:Uncharacterized protein n=1 Tax=Suillus plorans TaxID=116603 RepID=A0A9P7AK96_9AGAM|nr:uncharacterized protein HD556DRAFT_1445469 [Suillus plorans]KAG1791203.1 hypothetical protein HD556DRAFT_1445469 [Suillus plorans]